MYEKIIIFFKNMNNGVKFLLLLIVLVIIYFIIMYFRQNNSTTESMTNLPKNVAVDLYYSPDCGHCRNFKPEWEKLRQMKGPVFKDHNCKLGQCPADIVGVPTLKINGKVYTNEMNAYAIADTLKKMN